MNVRSTHRPQLLVDPTVTHVDGNNAHALCQRHFQIVVNLRTLLRLWRKGLG